MSVWCLTFFEREDMLMTNTRAVSMTTRIEVTKKLKQSYKTASKTEKAHPRPVLQGHWPVSVVSTALPDQRYLRQPQSYSYRPTQSKTTQVQSDNTKIFSTPMETRRNAVRETHSRLDECMTGYFGTAWGIRVRKKWIHHQYPGSARGDEPSND